MSALGYRAEPEYELCFPNELLQRIAIRAFDGVKGIGIRFVDQPAAECSHEIE